MVWILQNNSPRGQWPIGLVERTIRCPDDEVRSCYLRTHQGRTHTHTSSPAKSPHLIIEDSHTQHSTKATQRSSSGPKSLPYLKEFSYTGKRGGSVNEFSSKNYCDINDFRLFNESTWLTLRNICRKKGVYLQV